MVVRDAPVVSHVEHPEQARRPRRVEVVDVTDPTPRMRRVRLAGDLADLTVAGPTDHAKLFFPPAPGEEPPEPEFSARGLVVPPAGVPRPYREYTLRRHDPAAGTVDVDLVRHGSGLAGAWIEDPRGALWLLGPRSSAVVEPPDWYLLGGDETGACKAYDDRRGGQAMDRCVHEGSPGTLRLILPRAQQRRNGDTDLRTAACGVVSAAALREGREKQHPAVDGQGRAGCIVGRIRRQPNGGLRDILRFSYATVWHQAQQ